MDEKDILELAWGLIANVSGGEWDKQSTDWQKAARRWRSLYGAYLLQPKKDTYQNQEEPILQNLPEEIFYEKEPIPEWAVGIIKYKDGGQYWISNDGLQLKEVIPSNQEEPI